MLENNNFHYFAVRRLRLLNRKPNVVNNQFKKYFSYSLLYYELVLHNLKSYPPQIFSCSLELKVLCKFAFFNMCRYVEVNMNSAALVWPLFNSLQAFWPGLQVIWLWRSLILKQTNCFLKMLFIDGTNFCVFVERF